MGEAGRGEQQERRDARGEVAVRPGRRELRADPREHDRADRDAEQRGDGAAVRAARAQQRHDTPAPAARNTATSATSPSIRAGHGRQRGERRRLRPRRARVGGLVERVRDPRRVQQHDAAVGDQPGRAAAAAALVAARAPEQHEPRDPRRRPEEQRPVVGVEHRGERDREADRGRRARRLAASVVNACSQQVRLISPSSATSEYIRPSCAYCVRNGLTAASSAAIHAVRRPNSVQPAQNATGTHSTENTTDRPWTLSSERPTTAIHRLQQQVVERRRAVLAQHAGDVGERAVGDPDRQPLVDPEADAQLARAQHDGDGDQQADPQRRGDARAADRPCPQLPRRPGGVGGHAHEVRRSRRCSCDRRTSAGSC